MRQQNVKGFLFTDGTSIRSRSKGIHYFSNLIKCLTVFACLFFSTFIIGQGTKQWLSAGQDISNTHHASSENKISPSTVGGLQLKWMFPTGGDVSATPAVDNQHLYFPDWAGNLYKVDATTGAQVWRKEFKNYTGQAYAFARTTPAISGNTMVIGTQLGTPAIGAFVLGIDTKTGNLLWKTKVEDHFAAIVTQSAIIHGNTAFVGVASQEENFAASPGYPCCSFRGSILSININTGKINWKTYMTPAGNSFSGNAVWGSTPVVDVKRNSLYIATGNNYTVPQGVLDCVAAGGSPDAVKACIMAVNGSAQNYFDAIVSLNLSTGAVKWSTSVIPFDAWTVDCFFDGPNCPENAGPDYDFGQGPALFTVGTGKNKRELIGAGQKSGIYWALNPDNGTEVWHTQVGPGGTLGGLQWGSAVDGSQVYTAVSNNYHIPHLMTKGPGAGNLVAGGFWAALNAETGAVNWEFAGSNGPTPGLFPTPPGAIATNTGSVSVANGVMFGAAMDAEGTMYALNAATGAKLWSFESGGTVNAGAAIVSGSVYWGSGYENFGLGTPNHKLFAFHLPGNQGNRTAPTELVTNTKAAELVIMTYPSPAKDVMKVVSMDNSEILSLRVYDMNGRLLSDIKTKGSSHELNLQLLASGTYIINVVTTTGNKTTKVAVSH